MSRFSDSLWRWLQYVGFANYWSCDFGNQNTRISLNGKLVYHQPTALVIEQQSKISLQVGNKANNLRGKLGQQFQLLSPIKNGKWSDFFLALNYLKLVHQKISEAERLPWWSFQFGVVWVSSGLTNLDLQVWQRIIDQSSFSGLKVRLKKEKYLSFLSSSSNIDDQVLLIDIGASLTELIILQNKQAVVEKTLPIGGDQLTDMIIQHLKTERQLEISWQTGEQLKATLVSLLPFLQKKHLKIVEKWLLVRGKDIITSLVRSEKLSSGFFNDVVINYVSRLFTLITQCLQEDCNLQNQVFVPSKVVFCGQASLLDGLLEYCAEKFNLSNVSYQSESLIV